MWRKWEGTAENALKLAISSIRGVKKFNFLSAVCLNKAATDIVKADRLMFLTSRGGFYITRKLRFNSEVDLFQTTEVENCFI